MAEAKTPSPPAAKQAPPTKPPIADCPPDTVQLFQFPRGFNAPSFSPFVLKVETYLRLANIPYQNDHYVRFSPSTGKIPWIRYKGTDVSDSTLIVDYLNKERGVDLNEGLSVEQRAVCTAFERMVDEHLSWVMVQGKWLNDQGFKRTRAFFDKLGFGEYVEQKQRPTWRQMSHSQGMGRHPESTILEFGEKAMKALSDYLGSKPFMMGAEPTQLDCSVFGFLAQFLWDTQDNWSDRLIPEKFPNLQQYCVRMKDRVWPDWDDCITHEGTKPPKK